MGLKIGMVGTGGFSRMHASILTKMNDVEISGICGTSIKKADRMARDFRGAKSYEDLTKMLDEVKPDAVYLCVPPMAHGKLELTLIERGIPFFVEKPLGVDIDTPLHILKKMEEKPVITSVGYQFRYHDTVDRLKETLKGHTIGMISGKWNGDMPGVAWWKNLETSGGQFVEQTTHIVDLLRYLAGEVEEVHAFYGDRVMKDKDDQVTVPDVGTVNLRLESGVIANIINTCILPTGIGEIGLTFYTDKGILEWTPTYLRLKTDGADTVYNQPGKPYLYESEAFIHAVREQDPSGIRSDYADAAKTQKVTIEALRSAESNKQSIN